MDPFNTFLTNEMLIPAAESIAAIRRAGLTSFASFDTLEPSDIPDLCATLRRPGGVLARADGQLELNPGVAISQLQVLRLGIATHAVKYYQLVGRPLTADSMAWQRIQHFRAYSTLIKNHTDPTEVPTMTKQIRIVQIVDLLDDYFENTLGSCNVPLSYVTRGQTVVPDIIRFPLINDNLPYSPQYQSFHVESINRAPHVGPYYNEDNAKVMNVLSSVFQGTSHETSITPFGRTRDGRQAYQSLVVHNLGTNRWKAMVDKSEKFLHTSKWNGRNPRYTVTTHIARHRSNYQTLLKATNHIAYNVPSEDTRVTLLLASLECPDPSITAAKTAILSNPLLTGNFEMTANFLLTILPTTRESRNNSTWQISAFSVNGRGRGGRSRGGGRGRNRGGGRGNSRGRGRGGNRSNQNPPADINVQCSFGRTTGVALRFHNSEEYNNLNSESRRELYEWRVSQGMIQPSNSQRSNNQDQRSRDDHSISTLTTEVSQLVAQLSRNNNFNNNAGDHSMPPPPPPPRESALRPTQRHHPALSRVPGQNNDDQDRQAPGWR